MNYEHLWQPSRSGSDRVFLLLHGTGGDETSLLPLAEMIDPEASVLSVRGNVKEGSANRFFRRISEGVFDEEDLIQRAEDLAAFLTTTSKRYSFDLSRVVGLGYSNGANIAAAVMLLCPEALTRAILIRSMVPTEPKTLPNLVGKHVLMLTGESDPIVPVENAQSLERMFRAYGAEILFELLQAGHELTRRDVELASQWWKTQFPPGSEAEA